MGKTMSPECSEIAHFQEEVFRLVYDDGQRHLVVALKSGCVIVRRNTRSEYYYITHLFSAPHKRRGLEGFCANPLF